MELSKCTERCLGVLQVVYVLGALLLSLVYYFQALMNEQQQ